MQEKQIFTIWEYKFELINPYLYKDLNCSKLNPNVANNINAYDANDILLWNIGDLLKKYSDTHGLKYFDDQYYEIREIDSNKIYCIGNVNHCEIDLKERVIYKIINNR